MMTSTFFNLDEWKIIQSLLVRYNLDCIKECKSFEECCRMVHRLEHITNKVNMAIGVDFDLLDGVEING